MLLHETIKIGGECDVAVGFSTGPGSIVENVMSDSQISPPLQELLDAANQGRWLELDRHKV
jgi:hypothetical protein